MTALVARSVGIPGRLEASDLSVGAGELVALVGPNGGGKTSLLRAVARIEDSTGVAAIHGENIDLASMARRRKLLSFLPASRDVTWPIGVRDVIALGLEKRDEGRIDELVKLMELEQLAHRPINCLSTGERARVLMARALAARPQLLLLDEPLSNLDPYWVLRFLDLFREVAASGATILVALHDLTQLHRFDRALLISEGRIQMDEAPAVMVASERFSEIFRIDRAGDRWTIKSMADPRSLP